MEPYMLLIMVLLVDNEFVQESLATSISYLFFVISWLLSDSEDTEKRYWVVECDGKDSRIHVPHCFIYFFGAKKENKKKAWKQWVRKES